MSIDRTLRIRSSLVRHRNVLSRAERIALLESQDRWSDDMSPLGLPKIANRKAKAAAKKEKKGAEEEAVEGAEAAEAAEKPKT